MSQNNLYEYKTTKSGNEETGFFNIKGRISRKPFFSRWALAIGIYFLSAFLYTSGIYGQQDSRAYIFFETIHFYILPLLLVLFILIQGAKRMHDVNKSGWFFLTPFYNLYLIFLPGIKGNNDYGIDPSPVKNIQYFDELESPKVEPTNGEKKSGLTKWNNHINQVRKENRDKTNEDILKIARSTYNSLSPTEENKSQKTSFSYTYLVFGLVALLIVCLLYYNTVFKPTNHYSDNEVTLIIDSTKNAQNLEPVDNITWQTSTKGYFIDSRDNHKYRVTKIGVQIWMIDNFNANKFLNGDKIPQAKSNYEWVKAAKKKQPAWCYYDNNSANKKKHGKLYNCYAANDVRGLAPRGWHIPSDSEWQVFVNYFGGFPISKKKLLRKNEWNVVLSGIRGDETTFEGYFLRMGVQGGWWASENNKLGIIFDLDDNVNTDQTYSQNKGYGYSVRCIKD